MIAEHECSSKNYRKDHCVLSKITAIKCCFDAKSVNTAWNEHDYNILNLRDQTIEVLIEFIVINQIESIKRNLNGSIYRKFFCLNKNMCVFYTVCAHRKFVINYEMQTKCAKSNFC